MFTKGHHADTLSSLQNDRTKRCVGAKMLILKLWIRKVLVLRESQIVKRISEHNVAF